MNGMYGLLWASRAMMDSADASIKADRGIERAARAEWDIRYLEDRIDRLVLVCTALWELLRDRTELTEDDLLGKVREVDLRDGREDGKIGSTVKKCPKCGRTMSPRHKKCLYCGAQDLSAGAFDAAM